MYSHTIQVWDEVEEIDTADDSSKNTVVAQLQTAQLPSECWEDVD